jgi:hypothetical protein
MSRLNYAFPLRRDFTSPGADYIIEREKDASESLARWNTHTAITARKLLGGNSIKGSGEGATSASAAGNVLGRRDGTP